MAEDKKTPPKTTEEKLAAIKAAQDKALARFAERERSVKEQAKFGGSTAISQQKIVYGAWLWKLAQTDPEVKEMAKKLASKMDADARKKVELHLSVIDGKK